MILALMFTGTLIYRAEQRQPGASRAMTAAIVVGVLALTTFAGLWHGQQRHDEPSVAIQWATSVLLAGATFGIGLAVRHRQVPRWCAWLGMISYSVYLLHPLVFDAYRDVPALHRPHSWRSRRWCSPAACDDHRAQRRDLLPGREADAGAGPPVRPAGAAAALRLAAGSSGTRAVPGATPIPTGRARRRRRGARRAAARWRAGPAPRRSGPRPPTGGFRAAGRCAPRGCGPPQRQAGQQGRRRGRP